MWHNYIENPKFIEGIYGTDIIDLEKVRIMGLVFEQDGPACNIDFTIKQLPSKPPLKWQNQEFNSVSILVQLLEIEQVVLTKWSRNNIVGIKIERLKDDQKELVAISDNCELRVAFKWLYIKSVSPYLTIEGFANPEC